MTGFVDGAAQGRLYLGVAKGLGAFGGTAKSVKGNLADKVKYEFLREKLDYTEVRFGQFEEGLDEFYKDYKNKSILVDDAFGYVRASIRGEDQTELAHDLETLRKQSVSPSTDP